MLLERDAELGCLRARVDAALSRVGSTVAVEGPAGIGKSSLLRVACAYARERGMRVLTASGGELEREFAYGVVRQLFERELGPHTREQRLAGAARLAGPALGLTAGGLPSAADEHATLHGLYWLTANMASERPLLLVLDDAHWADPASQRFVLYLARRAEELALMILYAARTGEGTSAPLPSQASPVLVHALLRPRPLTEHATAVLVSQLLDGEQPDSLAQACHAASAGHPFLLHELLRELATDGAVLWDDAAARRIAALAPRAITRAILIRLQRLGPEATELAFALAVVGVRAQLRQAAAVARLDRDAAGRAADALASAGIVAADRPLRFLHPVVRSAVYAEIPPARRAATHRLAAEMLERDGAPADTLAPHLLACEQAGDSWIVERLQAAAATALARGAPDAACGYLQRALDEPPPPAARPAVLLALGSAELRAGRATAVDRLHEALRMAPAGAVRAEAATALALALTSQDRGPDAVQMLDATVGGFSETDVEARLRLEAKLICIAQVAGVRLDAARLTRFGDDVPGDSAGTRLLLASLAFDRASRGERMRQAVGFADRALTGDRLLAEHGADWPSLYLAGLSLTYADELERAQRLFDRAVVSAQDRGSLLGYSIAIACRSIVLLRRGRIAETEAEIGDALRTAEAEHWPVGNAFAVACLLEAMSERAGLDDCEALLQRTGNHGELPTSIMASTLLHARGRLRLARGDAGAALRDFDELQRRDDDAGCANVGAYNVRSAAALAHARLGDRDTAVALATDGLAAARRWGAPSAISIALRALAAAVADNDERIALLRDATEDVARSPARCERARALADFGAALRRGGQRSAARVPLRAALELAQACGALRLADRAREELVATGSRPRRAALAGRDALTPCELRVAGLAADGLSNRDIAQTLFVTVRTVETHLSHVYAKLDVCSRDRLAGALRDDEPGDARPLAGAAKDT